MKKGRAAILIGVILALWNTHMAFASDMFAPHTDLNVASNPIAVVSGDFNKDGSLDVATANIGNNTISVLIGNGDGTFQDHMDYGTGYGPTSVIASDFNNDGITDLATGNNYSSVSVFIGNGDGTFQPRLDVYVYWGPCSILAGDFNGDGNIDIATANIGYWNYGIVGNSISILMGNGDGTFYLYHEYTTGGTPQSITVADFNHDGHTDLATANSTGTISVFLGNGDGTFQSKIDYYASDLPSSIATGDFNGDGNADLVVTNSSWWGAFVSVFIGNGDGTFQTPQYYSVPWWATVHTIAPGDFNMDGKTDLATGNSWGSISILIGNGDGTFSADGTHARGFSYWVGGIIAGDFNGDNKADIVVANYDIWRTSISLLLNVYNPPPVANAGPDQVIECAGTSGTPLTLNGSGSSDPNDDPLTYTWSWLGGSADGINPTVQLPLGTTAVTLTVSDGTSTATDTVSIIVQDTTPPLTVATGVNGDWYNTSMISTFTAYDSCSGVKDIHYIVNGSETVTSGSYATAVLTADGIHNISYFAVDNAGNAEVPKAVTVKIDKTPPTASINTNPAILWPPDHKMVDVFVGGGAMDALSGLASIVFTVRDEYGTIQPSLSSFNTIIPLEAWREGTDEDGRIYTITTTATDVAGNSATASTTVMVPHDQR